METEKWLELANLIGNLQETLKTQVDINTNLISRIYLLETKVNQLLLKDKQNGE
jgi:hypothetical protein